MVLADASQPKTGRDASGWAAPLLPAASRILSPMLSGGSTCRGELSRTRSKIDGAHLRESKRRRARPWPPLWEAKARIRDGDKDSAAISNATIADLVAPVPDVRRPEDPRITLRLRNLVLQQEQGTASKAVCTQEFAQSCVMNFAIWRRFGTAEVAEALGWVERTDLAATHALLSGRAVEAAVDVWKAGIHAVAESSEAQRCARLAEVKAWELGADDEARIALRKAEQATTLAADSEEVAQTNSHLSLLRSNCVTLAGENIVRSAFDRLLNAVHHPIWAVWEKRESLVDAARGGVGFSALREELGRVRGYGRQDADGDWAGWELALDLKTLTPLSDDPSVHLSGDYAVFLRERIAKRYARKPSALATRTPEELGYHVRKL